MPVIPIVIDGAFEAWPRTKKLPSFGRVTICYGQLISAEKIKALGDEAFAIHITGVLRDMQSRIRAQEGKPAVNYY